MFDREPVIAIVAYGGSSECWAQLSTFASAARDAESRQGLNLLLLGEQLPAAMIDTPIVSSAQELPSVGGVAWLAIKPRLKDKAQALAAVDQPAVSVLLALQQAFELAQKDEIEGLLLLGDPGVQPASSLAPDELPACLAEIAATVGVAPKGTIGRVFAAPGLWHHCLLPPLPFDEIEHHLSPRRVTEGFHLLTRTMRMAGMEKPKIGLCSLTSENWHGDDEQRFGLLAAALEQAREAGIEVFGPWPAARIYREASLGGLDGLISLYRGQAEILEAALDMDAAVELIAGTAMPIARPRWLKSVEGANSSGSVDEIFAALRMLGVLARGAKPVFRYRGEGRLGNGPLRPTGLLPRTSTGVRRRSG